MQKTNRRRTITYIGTCLVALLLPIFAWQENMSTAAIIGAAVIGMLTVGLVSTMDRIHQAHEDAILEDLSELIDSIINGQNKEIFQDVEDTLLSKLQYQVTKLSNILNTQNNTINKEKEEIKSLISDISHQLKTPVASLKMFGELLSDESLSQEQRKDYINVINQSLDKLTFLTDSMIKMSRLESGIITITKEPCTPRDIILPAIKQAFPKAKSKDIEIIYGTDSGSIDPEEEPQEHTTKNGQEQVAKKMEAQAVGDTLLADIKWTTEAIFNIIDNAIKYSNPNTKITITTEKYPSFICLKVADEGRGISEEEQAMIFKRFYRGKNATQEEGVGIGLFLSREIIVNQGGYIKVSAAGGGTMFSVFLPIA